MDDVGEAPGRSHEGLRPLEGLRAVELGIAIAAPTCGRHLAHFGADVVKIESPTNPDAARLFGAAWALGVEELKGVYNDTGPYVSELSAGKRSVGLNLKHPEAKLAIERLLAQSDVFFTNYSTPAVRSLGLDYEHIAAIKPDIIYVAMPGFGSDPSLPYYEFVAWGPNQAPLVGLDVLTGQPDQEPAGIATISPPDFFSGYHGFIAILAALEHRERTGEGTFVDLSQFEGTVALLGAFLAQQALTGDVQGPIGSRSMWFAPEGVYRCRGNDRWVAISVTSDDEWRALAAVCEHTEWASDTRFATNADRRAHHDEIDALLSDWTAAHTAQEVSAWLQQAGVAAFPVQDNESVAVDPQVRDRGWLISRPSLRFETDVFMGTPMHLSATPGDTSRAGPSAYEHTDEVLTSVCGYEPDEVDVLVKSGAAFRAAAYDKTLHRPYERFIPFFVNGDAPSTRARA